MDEAYKIIVFGKDDCPKCKSLFRRLKKLLSRKPDFRFFKGPEYVGIDTERGLVEFCKLECINTSQIPAFIVYKRDQDLDKWIPVGRTVNQKYADYNDNIIYLYSGLQTDYSDKGKGVITEGMIKEELMRVVMQENWIRQQLWAKPGNDMTEAEQIVKERIEAPQDAFSSEAPVE